jgi:cephalosporin-C deacetylase-like acetyl esterase
MLLRSKTGCCKRQPKLNLPLAPILLSTALAATAWAQARHSVEQRYQMFQDYLVRRAAEVTRGHLAAVKTLADWERRRPQMRRQFLWMLGLDPLPKRTPLKPRITGQFERDTYRVEKIVFESLPGLYVTGNLYLPKQAQGRLPGVVYLSGHSPGPWGAKVQYQHHGIWLARHGYVAFLLDTIEFGEVPGIHHGTHDLGMWYWLSLGYTPAGPEVWNAVRALDYLETRPEVDAKRVAVTGISGGGAITWFAAAADERFQVAAPVCATWTVEHHAALDAVHENCDCIYFINTFLADLPAAGALIAPRPLKILSAMRDRSFPRAGYREVYQQVRRVYELYGAAERVTEYEHDAPHQDIPAFRKEAYEWINRWLKNDATPYEEGEIKREEPAILTVLERRPAKALNDQIHRTFIPAHRAEPIKTLEAWKRRRTELIGLLKEHVFRAFPAAKVPFEAFRSKEGGWTSRYAEAFNLEFTTEPGIRVSGQLFVPRGTRSSHPALIYVKGAADVVYPVDHDLVLPALGNHVVLVLNPRAVDYPANNYKMATLERTAALVGATIESMQLWDILRAVDYLTEGEQLNLSSISVYGRKQMGALALYAAALDERISRVVLDDPPASHWHGPALLNALRFTDLAEVAGLMAPREIVTLGPLPETYRYSASIYALHGQQLQIRRASGLSDALRVWEH